MVDRENRYNKPAKKAPKAAAAESKAESTAGSPPKLGEVEKKSPGGETAARHTRERDDMHKGNMKEMEDMHARHRDAHSAMEKRHAKEMEAMATEQSAGAGQEGAPAGAGAPPAGAMMPPAQQAA